MALVQKDEISNLTNKTGKALHTSEQDRKEDSDLQKKRPSRLE